MRRSGRKRENFNVHGGVSSTGPDAASVAKAMDWVRFRIAFYGSTRTYMPILELHGSRISG